MTDIRASDAEWERLRGFLPSDPPRGGRWLDHRMVINGIFFRTRTGCPWRDVSAGFRHWKTVYSRHRRWPMDGTWEQILDGLRLKQFRAVATRYDKREFMYQGTVDLASIRIWLRGPVT